MSLHAATRDVAPPNLLKAAVAFYAQTKLPLAGAYEHAVRITAENMLVRDAEEGTGAFMEKPHPR